MKLFKTPRFVAIVLTAVLGLSLSNCTATVKTGHSTTKTKKIPPGQAKKITGEKSAKNHAPGHNK